jgi:hypothetical protein
MRLLISILAGAALLAPAMVQARPHLSPAQQLARETEGRVAGDPVDCIDLRRVRGSRIINDTAIVYDAGSVIYVNEPKSGADSLDQWDTLVTRTHDTRLCSIDTVHLYDTSSRMQTGFVLLGDFVPYRKVRTGH